MGCQAITLIIGDTIYWRMARPLRVRCSTKYKFNDPVFRIKHRIVSPATFNVKELISYYHCVHRKKHLCDRYYFGGLWVVHLQQSSSYLMIWQVHGNARLDLYALKRPFYWDIQGDTLLQRELIWPCCRPRWGEWRNKSSLPQSRCYPYFLLEHLLQL